VKRGLQLNIKQGAHAGHTALFDVNPVVIGRDNKCDLVLSDAGVSRKHGRIGWQGGRYFIEDLGSLNGIYVNGRAVKIHWLTHGDSISVGPVTFNFTEHKVPAVVSPPGRPRALPRRHEGH
jgi:pSer/pThr/pTyr-binding forkhead associated (FHA) protein